MDRARKELSKKAADNRGKREEISDLAESIRVQGLINPITVRDRGDGTYQLLAGGRRLEAVKLLKWTEVPATIYPATLTEVQQLEVELMENLARKDLLWSEEIALKKRINDIKLSQIGYKTSANPEGWTKSKTADLLGESPATVSQDIELAEMIEDFPEIANIAESKQEATRFLKTMVKKFENRKKAEKIMAQNADTPLAKRRKNLEDSFVVGDFFTFAPNLEDSSFDLVNLDPPWGIDLDIVKKETNLTKRQEDAKYKEIKSDYLSFLKKALALCYNKLKPNSWLLLWYDIKAHNDIVKLCISVGFEVGLDIPAIWIKHSGQTQSPHRYLGRSWEPFLYIRKGRAEITKQGRLDSFDYPGVPQNKKRHRAEKPVNLMTDILATFIGPNSNILDPFTGSGNCILAANNLGCRCIGYDLAEENKTGFVLEVHRQEPGEYTSYN